MTRSGPMRPDADEKSIYAAAIAYARARVEHQHLLDALAPSEEIVQARKREGEALDELARVSLYVQVND